MRGDFTRNSFDREKHYSSVRLQQGRVGPLDADWNEQRDIEAHLARTANQDVIGLCGGPQGQDADGNDLAGFEILATGQDLAISQGRYYVHGILVENEAEVEITAQEDLPDYDPLNDENLAAGTYLAYLDVWERHITALDDDAIREVALGGPDTTTRTRVIWQVKLDRVGDTGEAIDCGDLGDWTPPDAASTGALAARAEPAGADEGPCIVPPGAGYRRLENQLYRVEIHEAGGIDAATFKWSRENGSIVTRWEAQDANNLTVSSAGRDRVLGFATGDWVELTDDTRELLGQPGVLVRLNRVEGNVLGIDPATIQDPTDPTATSVDRNAFPRNPKIRRWESEGAQAVTIPATGDGWIELEDGVQIRFQAGGAFQTGDYWTIPARTALGDVLWPLDEATNQPAFQPREGIAHAYCPLALLDVAIETGEDETQTVVVEIIEDCRTLFPPLTDICAEDVCYDNTNCDVIQATNVQEAIDQLCQMRDLRHHNKHLHGWGIVCGLQVVCGPDDPTVPDDRLVVTVRPGYAIDCEGNDIVLDEDLAVPVMEMIAAWEQQHPNEPLLQQAEDGRRGEVCLIVDRDEHGLPTIELRPYDPSANTLQKMLDGTLLMDFLQECILEPWQRIQEILFPPQEDGPLVGPGRRQAISLLNLLVQLWSPPGAHVYLSQREHDVLRTLYLTLRDVLQSETFCAMFDNARPFPDYPFPETEMTTIFDRNSRQRLRISPRGDFGFSVGQDANIHVYDLRAEELVAVVEVPGGAGLLLRDVALSRNGRELYAIGTVPGNDTVFAVADVEGATLTWRPVTIICDVELVTLVNMPGKSKDLLAAGLGRGLYLINLATLQPNIQPSVAFPAVGHLLVDDQSRRAYATSAAAGAAGNRYTEVVEVSLADMTVSFTYSLLFQDIAHSGEDDIAVVRVQQENQIKLYVVTEPAQGSRGLLVFNDRQPAHQFISLPNTTTRLGFMPDSRFLMASAEDFFLVGLVDVLEDVAVQGFALPVQIAPIAIAVSPRTDRVYVVNALSPTITRIAARYMQRDAEPTGNEPPPGSPEFVEQLSAYRRQIFDAFLDLVGGLLQYLKDCFCQHLLVNCPECDEDDEVYLGCVSIRSDEVYKVCNFSQRKYVKSFPTVSYWLSLVPIAPFIDKAVEILCCTVLPDYFGRVAAPAAVGYQAPLQAYQVRGAYSTYKQTDFRGQLRQVLGQVDVLRGIGGDWLTSRLTAPPAPKEVRVGQNEVAGKPVAVVTQQFQDKQVEVAAVERYDPSLGLKNVQLLTQAPSRLEPGAKVTLYEENGVVRYYAVSRAVQPGPQVDEIRAELEQHKSQLQEVQTLRQSLTDVQGVLAQRDQEVTTLRSQLQTLEQKQAALEKRRETAKLAEMEKELNDLRSFRDEVRKFMEEQKR